MKRIPIVLFVFFVAFGATAQQPRYLFRNTPLKTVMDSISRQFHYTVRYRNAPTDCHITGRFFKRDSLQKMLNTIYLTGAATFEIDKARRIITVKKAPVF